MAHDLSDRRGSLKPTTSRLHYKLLLGSPVSAFYSSLSRLDCQMSACTFLSPEIEMFINRNKDDEERDGGEARGDFISTGACFML